MEAIENITKERMATPRASIQHVEQLHRLNKVLDIMLRRSKFRFLQGVTVGTETMDTIENHPNL